MNRNRLSQWAFPGMLLTAIAIGVIAMIVVSWPSVEPVSSRDTPPLIGAGTPSTSAGTDVGDGDTSPSTSQLVSTAGLPFARYEEVPEGYVGTAVCASCHSGRHESYLATHHSRSLRETDLAVDVRGKGLTHAPSGRSYDVVRREGEIFHREWKHLGSRPSDRMQMNELPVRYVMGSGVFAQAYLVSDGKYLLQSPVTWYRGGDRLGMAPGYEEKYQVGFGRLINDECLYCHAGLVTQRDGNPHQPLIHELAIGCERCHGPGKAHAELYARYESQDPPADIDSLIVHPDKLDREAAESLCAQCHLHGDVVVAGVPSRQVWDFKPGQVFAATRMHYREDPVGELTDAFTGHFDQMWQSECYRQSDSMTCMTCHPSHGGEPPADRAAWRRQQCNGCHAEPGSECGVPLAERIDLAKDRCVQCHMPTVSSGIAHTSTTSHLITVYDDGEPRDAIEPVQGLRRIERDPPLPKSELERADLVAKFEAVVEQMQHGGTLVPDAEATESAMTRLSEADQNDLTLHSLLARYWRGRAELLPETEATRAERNKNWGLAKKHEQDVLRRESRPVRTRESALETAGNRLMTANDFSGAADAFTELTAIRRSAPDWYNLGLCLARLRRFADAERALQQAIRIDAAYAAPYHSLSLLYSSFDTARAEQYAAIARRLDEN